MTYPATSGGVIPYPATVTHDGIGNGNTIAYNVDTDSFRLRINTDTPPLDATFAPADIQTSPVPQLTIYNNGTVTFLLVKPGDEGLGLSYVTYGTWSVLRGNVEQGRVVFGIRTPIGSVPKTGSATFEGDVGGQMFSEGKQYGIRGSFQLNANFASNRVAGEFANMEKLEIGATTGTPWRDLSVSATITGSDFAGTVKTPDDALNGPLSGSFYGPGAQEIGGTWAASNSIDQAVGSFVGKRP